MKLLAALFLTFARIGLFTFGGGYAMLSLIENICVERKAWITHEEMMEITVIAESTPGPVAINCATYVGYKQKGFAGAAAATLGVVLPSFLIIFLLSQVLDRLLTFPVVANAFQGIKLAVGILILDVAIGMLKKMEKTPLSAAIAGIAAAAMLVIDILSLNVSTVALLLAAGTVSLALCAVRQHRGGKEDGRS